MPRSVATFLMFDGCAEEAVNFYVSIFRDGEIVAMERWSGDEPDSVNGVRRAHFRLAGHDVMCSDSAVKHEFTFTPSMSLFVECQDEAELDGAFAALSEGGEVLMAADGYGFSRRFGWVNDRFGVSWQLIVV